MVDAAVVSVYIHMCKLQYYFAWVLITVDDRERAVQVETHYQHPGLVLMHLYPLSSIEQIVFSQEVKTSFRPSPCNS